MRRLFQTLSGDHAITLAAALPDEAQALSAAAMTAQSAGLGPAQVRVLGPAMARASFAQLLSSQTGPRPFAAPGWLGVRVGLCVLGAVLGALFSVWQSGVVAVRSAPGVGAAVWATFGGISGFLLASLLHTQPARGRVLRGILRELRQGRWVVLVRPCDANQAERAEDALSRAAHGPVLRSA